MGAIKIIALAILLISFFTFVAFFGRLPAFRNTPIGALHRLVWIHIPAGFRAADLRLTNGRFSSWVSKLAHTLWNDKHPLVMIFFILLLSVSEFMFIPPAWSLMVMSTKFTAAVLVVLPYLFLYLSAYTDPGYITTGNHHHSMQLYPYDFTLFHPGQSCTTCKLLKPARSKHCSICKHCISKMDHHCIFINNCVGYRNQSYFLLLLFFTATLTTYATYIGTSLLSSEVLKRIPTWTVTGKGFTWKQYLHIWGWAIQEQTRIGAISLLCLLTSPLIWGLLGYHIYLIWAGTTTNESMKWSDWQAEMSDGFAFKRALPPNRSKDKDIEPVCNGWPCESVQVLLRTLDGLPPRGDNIIGIGEWERVWKLKYIENLYDLGFRDNLIDVFWSRNGLEWRTSKVVRNQATQGFQSEAESHE